MAQWGKEDKAADAPKFTTNAVTGESGIDEYEETVFGITNEEAAVAPKSSVGWVRTTIGTGGRAGRTQTEVLVAMRTLNAEPGSNN